MSVILSLRSGRWEGTRMALTDVIEADLLRALETGGDVEGVLHRYGASKGPLYALIVTHKCQPGPGGKLGHNEGEQTKALTDGQSPQR